MQQKKVLFFDTPLKMAVYVSPLNSQRKDLHIDAIDVNSLLCPLRAHTRIETERAGQHLPRPYGGKDMGLRMTRVCRTRGSN